MGKTTRPSRALQRTVGVVVCVLLVTSVIGTGVVAAQGDTGIRFAEMVTTEERGDVADVTLRLGEKRRAALSVRAPDGTYDTRVGVVDADEDGRVTVSINTFRAGWASDPTTAYAVGAGDRIIGVNRRTERLDEPLPEGRYNLVVSAGDESTAANLVLRPGTIGDARTATVPADGAGSVTETRLFETGRVAVGDYAVVAVNASGVGGGLSSSPPGENLVFPSDSTVETSTTHAVEVPTDRTVTPSTITVRYDEAGAPSRLDDFDADRIRHLGVDGDGDGIVDVDLRQAVVDVQATDRSVTLRLDTDTTVDPGETLRLAYAARNPEETGRFGVQAAVADGSGAPVDVDGGVVYGPAGRGTLGYGVDLRFTAEGEESVVDPLAAIDYQYADDRLYAVVNTSTLSAGERYGVGLTRWGKASPVATETVASGASVRMDERNATLTDPAPDDPFVVASGERTFRMTTTMAPSTDVVVEVSGTEPNSFLFRQPTTVGADRTFSATFDLPANGERQSITVRILDDGTVVGLERGVVDATQANN